MFAFKIIPSVRAWCRVTQIWSLSAIVVDAVVAAGKTVRQKFAVGLLVACCRSARFEQRDVHTLREDAYASLAGQKICVGV